MWRAPRVTFAQAAAIEQAAAERAYWAWLERTCHAAPIVDGERAKVPPDGVEESAGAEELRRAVMWRHPLCGQCDHSQGRHTRGTNKCKTCGKRCKRSGNE